MTTLNKLNNIYLATRTKLKSSVTRKQKKIIFFGGRRN